MFQDVQPQTKLNTVLRKRKTRLRRHNRKTESVSQRQSWPVTSIQEQSAPHVSIIDFNTLIRGGLELAIQQNNKKTRSMKTRNRKFRQRKRECTPHFSNDESNTPG